jgi:hypothetical protein
MLRETGAPGWSTVPATGVWVNTVCRGLTVVVVTGATLDEVDESEVVVVRARVVVVSLPTE